MSGENGWRRCSSCKSPIDFETTYWVCSVSTCNRKRTGLVFCSVSCWDAHLPVMRHREAWAEERISPDRVRSEQEQRASARADRARQTRETPDRVRSDEQQRASAQADRTRQTREKGQSRRIVRSLAAADPELPREILIVASKLKDYIRARSGMNTSDKVMAALSDRVRALCDRAVESARGDERKTVLERDIPKA